MNVASALRRPPKSLFMVACAAVGFGMTAPATADVEFSGSGYNPETKHDKLSAAAEMYLSVENGRQYLNLTLENTSGRTTAQGDALTGILFDFTSGATLSLVSMKLDEDAALWSSESSYRTNASVWGSWTDKLASSPRIPATYGLATTGFNSEFNSGGITLGGGGPNYGIVAEDTLPGDFNAGNFPFVQDSMKFKMKVTTGILNEDDISNVRFLFGTDGTGVVAASTGGKVPEPASFALLGIALAAARLARKNRLAVA